MTLNQEHLASIEGTLAALDSLLESNPRNKDELLICQATLGRVLRAETSKASIAAATARPDGMLAARESRLPTNLYAGMSLAEAAVAYLKSIRKPQQIVEIVNAIVRAGHETTAESAGAALNRALDRRATNYGDVIKIGRGLWVHTEHLDKKQLASVEHKERTRRGMRAARERGIQMGPAMKLNEEQAIEFKRLLNEGARPKHVKSVFSISYSSYLNYKKRLENWSPGDPFPPPLQKAKHGDNDDKDGTSTKPSLRVVT